MGFDVELGGRSDNSSKRERPQPFKTKNSPQKQKTPNSDEKGVLLDISLTMTYFHTGIRTIIGAEAFHC
ncbi:hypothetical protein, partial [Roseateles koreensis]